MTLNRLQAVARAALVIGAIGSLTLMFIHGRPSVFLLILFTGWILAPFIGLAWADRLSSRWTLPARGMLYYVMLLVAMGSLAIYVYDVASSYGRAVYFVAVPIGAWLLILTLLPISVALGRRSARG